MVKGNNNNQMRLKNKRNKAGKGGSNSDDDSSVDSKNNIRNLIDYDYSDSDEYSDRTYETDDSSTIVPREKRPTRRAALKARKLIKKQAININDVKEEKKSNNSNNEKLDKLLTLIHALKDINDNKNYADYESDIDMANTDKNYKHDKKSKNELIEMYDKYEKENKNMEDDEITDVSDSDEEMEYDDEDDDDEDDDEYYDDDEDDDDEDDDEEENSKNKKSKNKKEFGGIVLALSGGVGGGGASMNDNMVPRRYNMKKEPDNVKNFVKLLTMPIEDNSIDSQIDQFKALDKQKQDDLLTALKNRPTGKDSGFNLMIRILSLKLPQDIQGMIISKYNTLQGLDPSSNEYFKLRNWLDKVVSIPFGTYKEIPVKLEDGPAPCAEFMKQARMHLDNAVYGQDEAKLQVMQFISTKIANPNSRGLSLLLIGKPGIGKTSIIKNGIAKALNWPFQFISLGGDSDASTYTGHQLVYESSHCGKIVNSVIASKSMSTVMMFDELDKISQTPKGEEIQNMLVHLTDPVQNADFEDKYLAGVPIDLSRVMFVFSANDINKIDKILLDRMMVIELKGYDLKQKVVIAEKYLLPAALKEVNLEEKVAISKDVLAHVVEEYAKDENGVRELKRCLEQIVQKINMLRIYNSPELEFHIKDFSLPFIVKKDHIKLFLKKRERTDLPPPGMYI